jgi:hypothetical protein
MIVWVGMTCGNDNECGAAHWSGSRELQAGRGVFARAIFGLTDVPDSCYRRSGFYVNDSEESVYGDQGQEVAWEVSWEQFLAQQHQEESGPQQVPRAIGGRGGFVGDAVRVRRAIGIGAEW